LRKHHARPADQPSPADSQESQGQAPSCCSTSEPRGGGALCSLVLALRIHVHIPMHRQALQLTQISTFNAACCLFRHCMKISALAQTGGVASQS
jgi:hypothetical protein